jgi:hypothetical protein
MLRYPILICFLSISVYFILICIKNLINERNLKPTNYCDPYNIDAKRIVTSSDKDYNEARTDQFASRVGNQKDALSKLSPGIIAYCNNEQHIVNVINFAKNCDYKVTVRSGGHSYTGESSCSSSKCIQIDLSEMNNIEVNNNIIKVESGVKVRQLINKLILHKISVPHGACKNVGIGGNYQTSASGIFKTSYGSGLDYILNFKIVLSNATIITILNNTQLYKDILGSAPGSWGIITEYTLKGIPDNTTPYSNLIFKRFEYNKDTLLKLFNIIHFIKKDQEEKDLHDLDINIFVGQFSNIIDIFPDLPIVGSLSNYINVDNDKTIYIAVGFFWSGINSGKLNDYWIQRYLQAVYDLNPLPFPLSFEVSLPLSLVSSISFSWKYENYRFHLASIQSDHWWSQDFINNIADEMEERSKIPDIMFSFQYFPIGFNSQWYKNKGLNSLTWRDTRPYVDDWIMFKNYTQSDEIASRMRDFYEKNQKYNWMSTQTIYENSTDLKNETIAKRYFPNATHYHELRKLKREIDPTNMFSNKGTIQPL